MREAAGLAVDRLDLADDAALHELHDLQRAGYAVEAERIGFQDLPPLRETPEQLRSCGESVLAARDDIHGTLLGALSYELHGSELEICRLVVAPQAQRRGVGTRLLRALAAHQPDATRTTVATAAANEPALKLYRRFGFTPEREWVAAQGLTLVGLGRSGPPSEQAAAAA